MAKRGRPRSGKYNISDMVKIIDDYTDNTGIPILKEICYQQKWCYEYITQLQRENEQLALSIKRLLCKKESQLERKGLSGEIDKTMAVFSLKQLGWRDQVETNATVTSTIRIVDDV